MASSPMPLQAGTAALPRLVHFTRPDPPKMPNAGQFPVLVWEVALRSWLRYFPRREGFRHRVWRDHNLTDCMQKEFPEFLKDFLALPGGIERSDIGRYCVLHQQGGIYADLDYEARANFYQEIPSDLVSLVECRSKDPGLLVENSLMASPAAHPFWRLAIRSCFEASGQHRWDDAHGGTGPRLLSALYAEEQVAQMVHVLPCQDFQRGIQALRPHLRRRPKRHPLEHHLTHRLCGRLFARRSLLLCAPGSRQPAALWGCRARGRSAERAGAPGTAPGARGPMEPDGSAFGRAERLLREAVALRPNASDLRYLLGSAMHSQGRVADAIFQYCCAMIYDPDIQIEQRPAAFAELKPELTMGRAAAVRFGAGELSWADPRSVPLRSWAAGHVTAMASADGAWALWQVAPDAGVVASASLVGGSLSRLLATLGGAGGSMALGAASAATGALAAKAFSERTEQQAVELRLLEVKRHAPQSCPISLEPLSAARQMLEAVEWCLAKEERRAHSFPLSALCLSREGAKKLPAEKKATEKEYRKHLNKLRNFVPVPKQSKAKPLKGKLKEAQGGIAGMTVPGSSEAYERLFNPQWGTVRSKQGICAALAYLVTQFLQLKQMPTGNLQDGARYSLRLAVSSLARHHAFDEVDEAPQALQATRLLRPSLASAELDEIDEEEQKRWKTQPDQEQEFRSVAVALLCLLDAALSWRPSDPLGWLGQAEDAEGAVLAREKGVCSFPCFAGKVRKSMKRASGGCQLSWRRFEVHLDAMRSRGLPEPWPWIWVINEEGSMLVRNRTKVALRVELHRPKVEVSPFADLPLLKPMMQWFYGQEKPLIVAEVKPGIEWALRPKGKEGKDFRVKLLTKAGVVVCTRHLRRGQSFDFEVPVPPPPAQLRAAALASNRPTSESTMQQRLKATDAAVKAFGGEMEEDRGSVASTAAPSSRFSLTSTTSSRAPGVPAVPRSAREEMQAKLEERRRKVEGLPPVFSADEAPSPSDEPKPAEPAPPLLAAVPTVKSEPEAGGRSLLTSVEGFRLCLCPRCLHSMPVRHRRPRAKIYTGGVRCDHCKTELMGELDGEKENEEAEAQEGFCHCSRCWFDLCRPCAYKEMREAMKSKKVVRRSGMSHGIQVGEVGATKAVRKAQKGASPFPGFGRPNAQEVRQLHTVLARHFGKRRAGRRRREILDTVVGTILSQNTTNTNSHRAFAQLKQRFPSWDAVRVAKPLHVQKAIRCGGLAPKKTKWIKSILKTLHKERGQTSMEFLRKLDKDSVHAELERFAGVGKKTSAIINLFDCNNPDMAVDTHVFRYAVQLGWAPTEKQRKRKGASKPWPAVTRDTVYAHLDATFPDDLKYSMHLILTDTEGGLPVVCGARNRLRFDGKSVTVDGKALRDVVKANF
ncbi:unnamed protein product [Effrenium voratum]|uniref:HhH-GPD domain-containing protein n=1 Tax=Effrenium voratum TaxID=2562239 RepID=A0AA36IKC9_9DINO|nr:unnamed protein product [Effrenium voratum]